MTKTYVDQFELVNVGAQINLLTICTGKCTPLQAGKHPEKTGASITERKTSLHKDKLSRVSLFTITLLDNFNFVLLGYIPRFLFLKICFWDKKKHKSGLFGRK